MNQYLLLPPAVKQSPSPLKTLTRTLSFVIALTLISGCSTIRTSWSNMWGKKPIPMDSGLTDDEIKLNIKGADAYHQNRIVDTSEQPDDPGCSCPSIQQTLISLPVNKKTTDNNDEDIKPQQGPASWYPSSFQGKKTASGEPYDKELLTAAHRALPLQSYVKVTAQATGRSTIVRINDRGPYKGRNLIDLSEQAARDIGIFGQEKTNVTIQLVSPDNISAPSKQPRAKKKSSFLTPDEETDAVASQLLAPDRLSYSNAIQPPKEERPDRVLVTETTPPAPPSNLSKTAGQYFIQFGAFSSESLAQTLQQSLNPKTGQTLITFYDNFHRVQQGPYPNHAAAMAAARKQQKSSAIKTIIVRHPLASQRTTP